jgi:hypothetical protein
VPSRANSDTRAIVELCGVRHRELDQRVGIPGELVRAGHDVGDARDVRPRDREPRRVASFVLFGEQRQLARAEHPPERARPQARARIDALPRPDAPSFAAFVLEERQVRERRDLVRPKRPRGVVHHVGDHLSPEIDPAHPHQIADDRAEVRHRQPAIEPERPREHEGVR